MIRRFVYTCVVEGYDRVYPPVRPAPGIDHVLVTDDSEMRVPGWRTHVMSAAEIASPRLANRRYKMLGHRLLGDYDASLYVDGNIRLIGDTGSLFDAFAASGAGLGVYRHPRNASISIEAEECLGNGKLRDAQRVAAELAAYRDLGFADDQGLIEATILLKNHRSPDIDPAMERWWEFYRRYHSRDQLSLPVVLWQTGLTPWLLPGSFRLPNPWFGIYPHRGASGVRPLYADLYARSYDSTAHRLLLQAWQASWALRRMFRRKRRP